MSPDRHLDYEQEPDHSVLRTVVIIGLALLALPWVVKVATRYAERRALDKADALVDQALADTYPASDPPASHFVDIPINRQ